MICLAVYTPEPGFYRPFPGSGFDCCFARCRLFIIFLTMKSFTRFFALLCGILFFICGSTLFAQGENPRSTPFKIAADSLGDHNNHLAAARMYMREWELSRMAPFRKQAAVNAGWEFALAKREDSALLALRLAVDNGLSNAGLLEEEVFKDYRSHPAYRELVKRLETKKKNQRNPQSAPILTSDIDLFWKTYDRFLQDTANASTLFFDEYFSKGTDALQEYYRVKTRNIGGIKGFVKNIKTMPKFYAAIRANTLRVHTLKDSIRIIYQNLKSWHPDAVFPALNFHIGGWSSGGTSTDYGLHIGTDMYSKDKATDTSELNAWQRRNSYEFNSLKFVIAHELVHAQQDGLREDTFLLKHAIQEGMADFIGELISGSTANAFLIEWAKGKEKKIWTEFKKEMYLNRYRNWIANSSQERPDWPADLGYWVGYQICKAYFEQAADKHKAVYDMLHLRDYTNFLAESGWEEKLRRL